MRRLLIICSCLASPAVARAQPEVRWQKKTVQQWAEDLSNEDVRARWYATYALGQLGPEAAEAIDPLVELLETRTQHEYVRGGAAWAIGRMGAKAEPALDVLIDTLSSAHVSVRRNSAKALGSLGIAARGATPALLPLLDDKDPTVAVNAALALWQIEQHPKALRTLLDVLRQGKAPGPTQAAVALGRIGSRAQGVMAALVAALGHADADVRRSAARSLGQIGPAALPSLEAPLGDSNPEVRRGAVEALGHMGREAVPALIVALGNDSPVARRAAARALGRLGPQAKAAKEALTKAINDGDRLVVQTAARALARVSRP